MAGRASADPARVPIRATGPRRRSCATTSTLPTLGALIAFHEHRTFANAVLMGINPFDQFGVELGKEIARKIEAGGEGSMPAPRRCWMRQGWLKILRRDQHRDAEPRRGEQVGRELGRQAYAAVRGRVAGHGTGMQRDPVAAVICCM